MQLGPIRTKGNARGGGMGGVLHLKQTVGVHIALYRESSFDEQEIRGGSGIVNGKK